MGSARNAEHGCVGVCQEHTILTRWLRTAKVILSLLRFVLVCEQRAREISQGGYVRGRKSKFFCFARLKRGRRACIC